MTNAYSQRLPTILLVDDSEDQRVAMGRLLRRAGFAVDDAGDGMAAIEHVKHKPVDLVLLDLHMPEVDGFRVLAYLQEHHGSIPVILMSGMPLNQIQHKISTLPSHELPALLIKPVDPEQLLDVVDMQLSGELPGRMDAEEQNGSSGDAARFGDA